jgi:hypothetical protein
VVARSRAALSLLDERLEEQVDLLDREGLCLDDPQGQLALDPQQAQAAALSALSSEPEIQAQSPVWLRAVRLPGWSSRPQLAVDLGTANTVLFQRGAGSLSSNMSGPFFWASASR